MLEQLNAAGFDVLALHHAEAILTHDMPTALTEIESVLRDVRIPITELVGGGGGEAQGTQRMRREFNALGWLKQNIEVKKSVNGKEVMALSHEIDHVKEFDGNIVAMEIEWNNKDPFFDRDLESFKRLHAESAISVGVLITRGQSLQSGMRPLMARFAEERNINSLAELAPFQYRPTVRQESNISRRVAQGRAFRDAWVDAFVSDKFGEATTHWRKLDDRVRRGVGNPCPLLLIGIPASVVTFS